MIENNDRKVLNRQFTNKSEGAIRSGYGSKIVGSIVVDEVDILLHIQAIEPVGEEIVVVGVDNGALEATGKLEELR